jgi:ectoine hydroxylase-related dioxygenase (phytanoyl-CoA dioxygenase family)
MDFVELRDEQRRFFDEEGYLVVEDVLDGEEVGRLVEACDRVMAAYDDGGRTMRQLRPGIVEEPVFQSLIAHSKIVPLVVQLLSPDIPCGGVNKAQLAFFLKHLGVE